MAAWMVGIGIGLGLAGLEANAQSMPKEVAARVELYAIPTLTLSDQQFLTATPMAKPPPSAANFASRKARDVCRLWC